MLGIGPHSSTYLLTSCDKKNQGRSSLEQFWSVTKYKNFNTCIFVVQKAWDSIILRERETCNSTKTQHSLVVEKYQSKQQIRVSITQWKFIITLTGTTGSGVFRFNFLLQDTTTVQVFIFTIYMTTVQQPLGWPTVAEQEPEIFYLDVGNADGLNSWESFWNVIYTYGPGARTRQLDQECQEEPPCQIPRPKVI